MVSFVVFVFFILSLQVSHVKSQKNDCSDDAKRLTSLISNVTTHILESIEEEKNQRSLFFRNTTESKNALETEVLKAANSVSLQKKWINGIQLRITEMNSLLAKYEEENVNIKISSTETQDQCERNDNLFIATDNEIARQIEFIQALISFADNSKTADVQVLLEQIVQLLYTLKPSTSSPLSSSSVLLETEYQNFLQTKYISTVAQIGDALNRLIAAMQNHRKENDIQRENASVECKDELNSLNFKLQQNENKTVEAQQNLVNLSQKSQQNEQKLRILESEFDILNKAYQNKIAIISQVSEISSSAQSELEAENSQLKEILQQPLCCMCNDKTQ